MAIWINTGTISISAGGTTVTGSGTSFLTGGTQKGDMFQAPDGREYEITNITSDTQMSIYKAYQGTNVTGSTNWDIIPTQGYVKALVDEVREYVETNNTIVEEIYGSGLSVAHGGTGATTAAGARTNLGLGNVDNTSDANKPVSTAQQTALDGKLGISATAADSSKLGGVTPDGYYKKTDIVGAFGNLASPLLHLPLKKNLLTAQGQSICTFTRASAATYVDRYGMLKSVAADIPRFTADGLLIEGASTNLRIYSEQFDNAAWTKLRSSVSANATETTDPYGTNLADKLIEDTTATNTHLVSQLYSFTAGMTYTSSVYAKAGSRSQMALRFGDSGLAAGFDLSSGTVLSASSGVTTKITALSNGWYRVSATETAVNTGSYASQIQLMVSGATSYTGDGTSGLYIFGAQLEAMPFATSYIPTTATAVTRIADSMSLSEPENIPAYSGNFSIIVDVIFDGNKISNQYVIDDGILRLYRSPSRIVSCIFNGVTITGNSTLADNVPGRLAIVKNGTSLSLYLNGLLIGNAAVSNAVNPPVLYFGYCTLCNFRAGDRALTAEEVRLA